LASASVNAVTLFETTTAGAGDARRKRGHRFDGNALLLDPYALAASVPVDLDDSEPAAQLTPGAVCWSTRVSIGSERPGRRLPGRRPSSTRIHPSANCDHPGTFLGVIDKIPYFRELGVTAVELMPVQEFRERSQPLRDPVSGKGLRNYWRYDTISFFAPAGTYAAGTAPGDEVDKFKAMVRELHRAGIEVILDVVFNHTAEGDEHGPLFNFRGLDNEIYYMVGDDKRVYRNFPAAGTR
jgi:isoamylase